MSSLLEKHSPHQRACLDVIGNNVATDQLSGNIKTINRAFSMISVGLLVASRTANEELAGGLLNTAIWPILFLSKVWFSLDDAPDWMQNLADLMPLTHIVKATREVMIEGATLADIYEHLLLMVILTVICLALSAKLFRWNQ